MKNNGDKRRRKNMGKFRMGVEVRTGKAGKPVKNSRGGQ